jgi:hypothetical protein
MAGNSSADALISSSNARLKPFQSGRQEGGGHRDARAGKDDELAAPRCFHQRRQRCVGRETRSVPGDVAVFSDAEFGLHCKVKQARPLPQRYGSSH